ncbi:MULTISPECIES: fatty-acid--CoA ligase [unclassified Campylobacter]|uniref:fatty-acid--CoA ligase n=1 Tax=unclassified Campylobacter TaxID=2593542 RepID=UPI003D327A57
MIWALVAIFILLCLALLFLILKLKAGTQNPNLNTKITPSQQEKTITIDDLLGVVLNPNSSKNDIFGTCRIFVEKLSIPPKQDDKALDDVKKYLKFITLVASHKNVDAKLILYLGTNAKKKNPSYEREIEISETDGINNRAK